jgi:hypothetical protein
MSRPAIFEGGAGTALAGTACDGAARSTRGVTGAGNGLSWCVNFEGCFLERFCFATIPSPTSADTSSVHRTRLPTWRAGILIACFGRAFSSRSSFVAFNTRAIHVPGTNVRGMQRMAERQRARPSRNEPADYKSAESPDDEDAGSTRVPSKASDQLPQFQASLRRRALSVECALHVRASSPERDQHRRPQEVLD